MHKFLSTKFVRKSIVYCILPVGFIEVPFNLAKPNPLRKKAHALFPHIWPPQLPECELLVWCRIDRNLRACCARKCCSWVYFAMFLNPVHFLKRITLSKATERHGVEAWDQARGWTFRLSLVISMKVIPWSDRVLVRLQGWGKKSKGRECIDYSLNIQ